MKRTFPFLTLFMVLFCVNNQAPLEENSLDTPLIKPATCFAPDTDSAVIEAFYKNKTPLQNGLWPSGEDASSQFNLVSRWSSTALDGGGLGQGDITTLTWSYVPDGTPIGNGGCGLPDAGTFSSDFISFFNGIYGPPTTPGDFTTAPWHNVFVNMFNSWSTASGLIFVYEPNDDGSTVVLNPGIAGVRGDIRISGHLIDGNSNVLACNYFPNSGDMIIDTGDNFYSNNPGLGTSNVLAHEIGHGLGVAHVCPVNQSKLMEPFISVAFNGPQEDDILATNRHYGDPDGVNDSSSNATFLGSNALPTSYSRVQRSIDDNGDTDYFSFTINAAAQLSGTLTPTGTTYLEGPQNSGGSCSAGTPFNALTISDLMLEIIDTDGASVLATAATNGPGGVESLSGISLSSAGTYFVRIQQQGSSINNVQMYDLDVSLVADSSDAPPTAMCTNFTAQLDASGNVTIDAADVDGGSSDPEGSVTLSVNPNSFTCSDIGANTVTLTVTDSIGQTDTCTATVTVEDITLPSASCQDFTVQLDASGNASITAADIDNGSNDNCGIASLTVSPNSFTCTDIGANTVTLTVTDDNGNVSTCTSNVTVEDTMAPTASCQDFTVQLDASGNASITAADIDNGSNDNCGIASLTVSPNSFTCADIGTNTVTLTVTDNNGNVSTCTSNVTVEDTMAPTASCQDFTVQLDASGNASITAADIDNGSNDNCGNISLVVSPNTFTCADVGSNTVTLTVTDGNGNTATCTATVTVEDTILPTAICQDLTVQIDSSCSVTITAADIDNGSNDNCGIATTSISPSSFTCDDIGPNAVILTVTDDNGNVSTCTSTVTVEEVLGVEEATIDLSTIAMSPNPFNNAVTVSNPNLLNIKTLIVYDILGRKVFLESLEGMAAERTIDVSHLKSALYIFVVKSDNGQLVRQMIKK